MSKRVIYIEDEPLTRSYISKIISSEGFEVKSFDNGLDGFNYFKNNGSDIIVLDLDLPKLTGVELIKKVRRVDSLIPIIVISGSEDRLEIIRSLNEGAWEYLIKPIKDSNLLIFCINRAIERSELKREDRREKIELEAEINLLKEEIMEKDNQISTLFYNNPVAMIVLDLSNLLVEEFNREASRLYQLDSSLNSKINYKDLSVDSEHIELFKQHVLDFPIVFHHGKDGEIPVQLKVSYYKSKGNSFAQLMILPV